jgi:hypothetical protein
VSATVATADNAIKVLRMRSSVSFGHPTECSERFANAHVPEIARPMLGHCVAPMCAEWGVNRMTGPRDKPAPMPQWSGQKRPELTMSRKLDLSAVDFHALSQAERSELYRLAMRCAHEERAREMAAMFRALAMRLRNARLRRRILEGVLPARLMRA